MTDRLAGGKRARRLTKKEWEAIVTALSSSLAGPLDGYDGRPDEETEKVAAMESALDKAWERL